MLLLLDFLNILEDSVFYLMYFSMFHSPCEQAILWLQLLICFISVSPKRLLDRSVFADGCYYGFETNVEQLYGARLSVSTAVSICFTDSHCKLVLIQQQGKIFFIQVESNTLPLTEFVFLWSSLIDEDCGQLHCWSLKVYFQKKVKWNSWASLHLHVLHYSSK